MSTKDIAEIIFVLGVSITLILVLGGDTIISIIKALRGEKDDDE